MDVQKLNIINSAEKLLKNKQQAATSLNLKSTEARDQIQFSSVISSKYYKIQSRLKDEQNELTKTQTKLGILNEPDAKKEDLINILFGKTPLFKEISAETEFNQNSLIKNLMAQKEEQINRIKSLEVESENIFSAGMLTDPSSFEKSIKAMKQNEIIMNPISEKSVERLIRD